MSMDRIEGAVKTGVGRLQDGAGGLTGDTELQTRGKLNQAAGFVQDLVGQAKDHVSDLVDAAKHRSSDRGSLVQSRIRGALANPNLRYADVEKLVVQNPLAALGVAAFIGVGVGLLLKRR